MSLKNNFNGKFSTILTYEITIHYLWEKDKA